MSTEVQSGNLRVLISHMAVAQKMVPKMASWYIETKNLRTPSYLILSHSSVDQVENGRLTKPEGDLQQPRNVDPGLINPGLLIWGCCDFSEDLSLLEGNTPISIKRGLLIQGQHYTDLFSLGGMIRSTRKNRCQRTPLIIQRVARQKWGYLERDAGRRWTNERAGIWKERGYGGAISHIKLSQAAFTGNPPEPLFSLYLKTAPHKGSTRNVN